MRRGGKAREESTTYVERLSEPTGVMVEERTPSGGRIDEGCGRDGGKLWHGFRCGLFEHERLKRGLEAQQRRKGDIHHQRQKPAKQRGKRVLREGENGRRDQINYIKRTSLYSHVPIQSSPWRRVRGPGGRGGQTSQSLIH